MRLPPSGNHHVLITGTSTGIGRACAFELARQGFSVWAGIRNSAEADSINQAGETTPTPIRPIEIDVTDMVSIRSAQKEIRSHVGDDGLYALVNNAGICVVGPVEFIPLEAWRQQLDVNFFGVIAVTQIMLPLLRANNSRPAPHRSRIVNMGSITGEISTPLFGAYSASKFALRAMNDALRLELRPEGIHVSLIVPGTIQSEIWRKEKECVDAIVAGSPARAIRHAHRQGFWLRLPLRRAGPSRTARRGCRSAMPHQPQTANSIPCRLGGTGRLTCEKVYTGPTLRFPIGPQARRSGQPRFIVITFPGAK